VSVKPIRWFSWLFRSDPVGESAVVPSPQKRPDEPPSKFSDDDYEKAALNLLWPIPRPRDSFWGGNFAECDAAHVWADQTEAKYSTLSDPRMKRHVMGWISFVRKEAEAAREDLRSQKHKREHDEYSARLTAERHRADELAAIIRAIHS
jgi:hypothetical protein